MMMMMMMMILSTTNNLSKHRHTIVKLIARGEFEIFWIQILGVVRYVELFFFPVSKGCIVRWDSSDPSTSVCQFALFRINSLPAVVLDRK